MSLAWGLIVVGDEILSGKRLDKHLTKVIELLDERGLALTWTEYVGDAPQRITATLKRAFDSGDVVFCTGGIGATPDDHTRLCAAQALGVELALHAGALALIEERMRDLASEQREVYEPNRADNLHRHNMGIFPVGATLIPNPYNKIPGFSCAGSVQGAVHFVPGFPVMAWPMLEWVLDTCYAREFHLEPRSEKSVIVLGQQESVLTPLMLEIERQHPNVSVFSLPSVAHPVYGKHIELGVKGRQDLIPAAWQTLLSGLHQIGAILGPELVR